MATLTGGANLGNGSASALLRTANSLQSSIAAYEDSLQAYEYSNSAYTDTAFGSYKSYLNGRISTLNTAGGVSNAQKALTLTRALDSAGKSNISASIQRENIQVMAGNASLQDKYNVVVNQYMRASSNDDMTLAQSLMGQAYSISQSIQYQAVQAASAAKTLSDASQTGAVTHQSDVVTSLDNGLKELNAASKNQSEADFNKYATSWVSSNSAALAKLGVVLPKGAQPNYFDIVQGVVGAKYNALVLKAQAEAPINPAAAANYAQDAQFLNNGVTKIPTLGGNLSLQELQQAASDPKMFAYDNSTGSYQRTTQTGYQYLNGQVAPTYSGYVSQNEANKFSYLTVNQTKMMTSLGLNFSESTSGKSAGTTGNGVQVQVTENSPDWLKSVLGQNGTANFFTDNQGNETFKSGDAFYTVAQDAKGLSGLYEHLSNGNLQAVGGDYGFDQNGVQMLLNQAQQTQLQITAEENATAAKLKLAAPLPLPKLKVAPPAAPKLNSASSLQPTSAPQLTAPIAKVQNAPNVVQNVAPGTTVQSTTGGFNLNQAPSSGGGLKVVNF